MDYLSFMLFLVSAWAAVNLILSFAKKGNDSKLPPGPTPLPIVGNLFSLGSKPHISLAELAKKYGPLMILQLGRVPTVIISSADVAKEALQKNNLSFSNRMVLDGTRALGHHEKSIVWLPVSSLWRNLRKISNTHVFSISRLDATQSLRRKKVNDLLKFVEKSSEFGEAVDISQAASTTALNLLANTLFSLDLGNPKSEFARDFKKTTRDMLETIGIPNIADYFPILQKIDPQGIRRRMGAHFAKLLGIYQTIIDQRLQNKKPSGSEIDVLDSLLGIYKEKTKEIESADIPTLFLELFTGGTDTTSSTLEWAMAELLKNPEKLKKAKAELHEIIGKGNPVEEPDTVRL